MASNIIQPDDAIWALQMFDSNGRFPMEGSLTDSLEIPMDICNMVVGIWPNCTNIVPAALRMIHLLVPVGYAINPGSYESCLGVGVNSFRGKYCTIFLEGPPGQSVPHFTLKKNKIKQDG